MRRNAFKVGDRVELDLDLMDDVGSTLYKYIGLCGLVGTVIFWRIGVDCALPEEPVYSVRFPEGTIAECFEEELMRSYS